jgi:hypothetical protein
MDGPSAGRFGMIIKTGVSNEHDGHSLPCEMMQNSRIAE